MKKKTILCILAVLLVAAVAGIFLYRQEQARYVTIHGERFLKELTELDLRDRELTVEEYETFRAALPECQILWSVPFQGTRVADDATSITMDSFEDLSMLDYLPHLQSIDATGCQDYEALITFLSGYPHYDVQYQMEIGGEVYDPAVTELNVAGNDLTELCDRLVWLPEVSTVTLVDPVNDAEGLKTLLAAYPEVEFRWNVMVLDRLVSHDTLELDISGTPLDGVEEVEAAIECLPNMQKVIMCDCGISNEEMDALNRRHESVKYVWSVVVGKVLFGPEVVLRTDVTTYMPIGQFKSYPMNEDLYNLRYCTDLILLDLGHRQPVTDFDFLNYLPNLKYLLLCDTGISDLTPLQNMDQVVFLELFMCDEITDFTPLLGMTALEDLNLNHTSGDPSVIAQMTWLKNLWWFQAPRIAMTPEEKEMLRESLPNTRIVTEFYWSTAGGWRKLPNYYAQRDLLGMRYMD